MRYIIFGAACSVLAFDDSDDFKYDELEDHVPSKFALWQGEYTFSQLRLQCTNKS